MNIDDIFKIPAIPAGRNKRKMPATPDIQFFDKYKDASELPDAATVTSTIAGEPSSKRSKLSDEDEDDVYGGEKYKDDVDVDLEDEEGRFFGGGLTEEQSNILDLVDEYDAEETEALTANNVKKMILKFEKAINKNQEMRVRYADQPEKFMESEADLDEEIKNLLALTEAPHLYPEFVKLGSVASLLSLLSHENTDIAIDTIDLINELIDEDVGVGSSDEELERTEEVQQGIKSFVEAMLENELLPLLVQNLGRLNEDEEADRQGVFKTMGIFENIISLEPKYAEDIALKTDILPWLLKRLQKKEFDANIEYASEILSILLQDNRDIRLKVGELDGIDTLLTLLAGYRRKDAETEDESEMVENLFNGLCLLLNEEENKKRFLDCEGIELMVIMLKERTLARIRAVKVLNYALNGSSRDRCIRFVDVSGLKVLFPLFMGKNNKKLSKSHKSAFNESEDEEHISCIILSLLRNLRQDDVQRMRVILKFTEDDYEKVDRLIELKEKYENKDEMVKQDLEELKKDVGVEEELEDFEADLYVRRLDAGLFTLQRVCLLIAALSEEDKGVREKALLLMKRKGQSMLDVFKIIEEETALMADFISLRRIARGEEGRNQEQKNQAVESMDEI
ncbi:DUF1716-domain-containing protein [Mycotypha africana]|uniref:DUF1716-domain-containing protein n=1 Tax=Mycotypha africana TaxID=64632 RepID=UPI002300D28A|nr:DUF1716-domain-containing protein [Mycotypha africana]KAI8991535.1 DUF1716-domain-containing protein [Mycotypha africana]